MSTEGTKRSVFNRVVQGLGADIQRWVLRRLAIVLPYGARVVSQTHCSGSVSAGPTRGRCLGLRSWDWRMTESAASA